jgi:hypothetical protein
VEVRKVRTTRKSWQLSGFGYAITELEDGYWWESYLEGYPEGEALMELGGWAALDESALFVLGPTRVLDDAQYGSLTEAQEAIGTLPSWDGSRYFAKLYGLGPSCVYDLRSGEMVDPIKAAPMMEAVSPATGKYAWHWILIEHEGTIKTVATVGDNRAGKASREYVFMEVSPLYDSEGKEANQAPTLCTPGG